MTSEKKFGMLRTLLRALGLSAEAVDDVVDWIVDLLAGENKETPNQAAEYPYRQRDHFLSPAELHFFKTLRESVNGQAMLCAKVSLGDLFWVKSEDQSRFRSQMNKIDRKHVDFLLCEPATMRPLVGIELDDKSHQRPDRQARDAFVDQVFAAAGLPLLHIPAKRAYELSDIADQLAPYLRAAVVPAPSMVAATKSVDPVRPDRETDKQTAQCPKCGSPMILRTAKTGPNAGQQFWGCSKYPSCRGIMTYDQTG